MFLSKVVRWIVAVLAFAPAVAFASAPTPALDSPDPFPTYIAAPVPASQGEVLGEQSYRFTSYLMRGMRGDEVQNLQAILIAEGFLPEDSLSGYFGAVTQKALRAYQAAHGISQTGTVGPLTRTQLNKSISPAPTSATPKQSNLSKVQTDAILGLMLAFGADAKMVASVSAALGR